MTEVGSPYPVSAKRIERGIAAVRLAVHHGRRGMASASYPSRSIVVSRGVTPMIRALWRSSMPTRAFAVC
ncbi:hypothetical protein CEQ30_01310 [Nocardia brasiliensis]|nr:hypothetical protein CEQ30_01310 [Nocardia brasiliensis]SUB53881.1 Uncharacterised protein [Nocardia brasiliensis]